MLILQLNNEHFNSTNSVAASQCDSTGSGAADRSPAAVRQRVVADLRQRISALTPAPLTTSLQLDMDEVAQCQDVHRLAELLKLRLASVSPHIDDTRVDKYSGLVTVKEASGVGRQVPVPMYRQDSHGRFILRHYIHVTAQRSNP